MSDDWNDWWRERGDDRLSLLLWAVWNPIGPVPLDEYEAYTGKVISVLKEAHQADLELLPPIRGCNTLHRDAARRDEPVLSLVPSLVV
jgi:hypothetical protein